MMTKLYWSIVNNEIKMPNQLENKVVIELPPTQKEHIALLSCVQTHIALLKEYAVKVINRTKLTEVGVGVWTEA